MSSAYHVLPHTQPSIQNEASARPRVDALFLRAGTMLPDGDELIVGVEEIFQSMRVFSTVPTDQTLSGTVDYTPSVVNSSQFGERSKVTLPGSHRILTRDYRSQDPVGCLAGPRHEDQETEGPLHCRSKEARIYVKNPGTNSRGNVWLRRNVQVRQSQRCR